MKPPKALNVNTIADLSKTDHSGLEMGQKSVVWHFFYVLVLLDASLTSYVASYAPSGSSGNGIVSSAWDKGSGRNGNERLNLGPQPPQTNWEGPEGPIEILQQPPEGSDEYEKWLKVFAFDKSYNLSETDRRADNESRVTVISEDEHLEVYENKEDEGESRSQLQENIFHLLNSENLFPQIRAEKQSRDVQRSKREAEGEPEKKKCRCRRVWRRTGVRRRRRRRRNGQRRRRQRRGRRRRSRRRRRGRRRCVCRKGDGEEGKSDGEEPEVENADGSGEKGEEGGEGEEGGGEGDGEGGGEGDGEGGGEGEGDGEGGDGDGGGEGEGEGDGDGEGEEAEGSDETSDDESSEEEGGGESPPNTEGGQLVSPGGAIPIPPGSMVVVPGHAMPPYPNMMPPPNVMPNTGGRWP